MKVKGMVECEVQIKEEEVENGEKEAEEMERVECNRKGEWVGEKKKERNGKSERNGGV